MSKHERSWPLALGAVVLGIAAGSLFLGMPSPKVPMRLNGPARPGSSR